MITFKLDDILKAKGLTKADLSRYTGIDNNSLGKIANNKSTQIKLETLYKICVTLNCQISDLLELEVDKDNIVEIQIPNKEGTIIDINVTSQERIAQNRKLCEQIIELQKKLNAYNK